MLLVSIGVAYPDFVADAEMVFFSYPWMRRTGLELLDQKQSLEELRGFPYRVPESRKGEPDHEES